MNSKVTRRGFLKTLGVSAAAAILPASIVHGGEDYEWDGTAWIPRKRIYTMGHVPRLDEQTYYIELLDAFGNNAGVPPLPVRNIRTRRKRCSICIDGDDVTWYGVTVTAYQFVTHVPRASWNEGAGHHHVIERFHLPYTAYKGMFKLEFGPRGFLELRRPWG